MILFLENQKRISKFIKTLSKDDLKNTIFINASDELVREDFPKKGKIINMEALLPPPNLITKFITSSDKKEFQIKYYRYLSKGYCAGYINKMVGLSLIKGYNILVCFGDIEKDLHIPKYIKTVMETSYDIKVFEYKDWDKNPDRVNNYIQKDMDIIIKKIYSEYKSIFRELAEADSCNDGFLDSQFFRGGKTNE